MKRIQRQRTTGWRMPEGAIYVGRPSKWGNPFRPNVWAAVAAGYRGDAAGRRAAAVALYRAWVTHEPVQPDPSVRIGTGEIEFGDGMRRSIGDQLRAIAATLANPPDIPEDSPDIAVIRRDLRGHDLACWCPLDQPCHADVLLELAA